MFQRLDYHGFWRGVRQTAVVLRPRRIKWTRKLPFSGKEGWTLTWKRNLHRPDEEFAVEKKIKWVLTSAISLINVLPAPALHGVR